MQKTEEGEVEQSEFSDDCKVGLNCVTPPAPSSRQTQYKPLEGVSNDAHALSFF